MVPAYTYSVSKSCISVPDDVQQSLQASPLQPGLHSGKPLPCLDAGVVAIGERQLEGVVSDELDVPDANIVRYRVDVERADSRPLVNAAGAGTLTPEPSCLIAAWRAFAPGDQEHALRSLQLNISGRVAHDRLAQSGLVDTGPIRTNHGGSDTPYRPS